MVAEVRHRLKALRKRAGLRSRDVAEGLGMAPSSYQKYEDRRKGHYLPLGMVAKLVLTLEPHGISPEEIWDFANAEEADIFHRAWALKKEAEIFEKWEGAPATKVVKHDAERRRHERWNPFPANVRVDGLREQCVVKDISAGGARVISNIAKNVKDNMDVTFELAPIGETKAKVIQHKGDELSLIFTEDVGEKIENWLMPIRESHRRTE